jgi:hypothetical protein
LLHDIGSRAATATVTELGISIRWSVSPKRAMFSFGTVRIGKVRAETGGQTVWDAVIRQ